ncbi:MAG: hypothetical protein JSR95_17340 [Proteobacteria bacterium]|nr:hypothetical protein [Pseudomonadota bacterium]
MWRAVHGLFIVSGLYAILYSPVVAVTRTGVVRPLVILGLLLLLAASARAGFLDMRVPRAVITAAVALFIVLAAGQTIAFFGGADLFLRSFILGVFTGVLPLTFLIVWLVPERREVLEYLIRATAMLGSLQSFLIVADWISPTVRAMFGVLVMQPETLDQGIRAAGLTSMTGDGLSVSQAICAVCAMYLAVTADRIRAMIGWGSAVLLITATMMFVGRTGFVLIGFFAMFLVVFERRRMRVVSGALMLCLVLAGTVWAVMSYIDDERLAPLFSRVVSHAFEAVIGVGEGEGLHTASTQDLGSMIVFPDTVRGWMIGYGYYNNPADPDANYMGTDIGYLRVLFYVGALGSILIYLWYLWIGYSTFRMLPKTQERILCSGLIGCFFLSQLKFSFLLLLAPMGFTLLLYLAALRGRWQ